MRAEAQRLRAHQESSPQPNYAHAFDRLGYGFGTVVRHDRGDLLPAVGESLAKLLDDRFNPAAIRGIILADVNDMHGSAQEAVPESKYFR